MRWSPFVAIGVGMAFPAGCVDTTPLVYEAPKPVDAGADAGVSEALKTACRKCITEPGAPCRADFEACEKDPRCVKLTDCLFDDGCFSLLGLSDRIACGTPCFELVGLRDSLDPVLQGILPLNVCTQGDNPCGKTCTVE